MKFSDQYELLTNQNKLTYVPEEALMKPEKPVVKRKMEAEESDSFNQNKPPTADRDLFSQEVKLSDVRDVSSKSLAQLSSKNKEEVHTKSYIDPPKKYPKEPLKDDEVESPVDVNSIRIDSEDIDKILNSQQAIAQKKAEQAKVTPPGGHDKSSPWIVSGKNQYVDGQKMKEREELKK